MIRCSARVFNLDDGQSVMLHDPVLPRDIIVLLALLCEVFQRLRLTVQSTRTIKARISSFDGNLSLYIQ